MGQEKSAQPVKLIVGMLSKEQELFVQAQNEMEKLWGPIDVQSQVLPFTYTNYYRKQMGHPLWRKFVAFGTLIDPAALAQIKHQSNDLESRLAQRETAQLLEVERPINLDPGYIEPSKLVLASTKNYSHRVYLGQDMYAEATLHYSKGAWHHWPFSYPDYASGDYDPFLSEVRTILVEVLSSRKQEPSSA